MSKTKVMLYNIQAIYQLMTSGKIVIPAFQRKFVWSKSQVKKLLQSIYKGYPIGTFLMLEDQFDRYPAIAPQKSLFPPIDKDQDLYLATVWYIIDGSQRLAALYNSLFGQSADFEFWFDLETEEFITSKTNNKKYCINLRSLYSSEEFRKIMVEIAKTDETSGLFDNLKNLHMAFKDYEVVVQVLIDTSLDEAIEIFTRLNSSGMQLSKTEIDKIKEDFGK